jgi:hypothetical protein
MTATYTVMSPWESYSTKDGRWVVVLDDAKGTTYTFDESLRPNYITVSEEYGVVSFRLSPPPYDSLYAEFVTVWEVVPG